MLSNLIVALLIVVVVGGLLSQAIRIAREYQRLVVFRLGKCLGVKGPGPVWLLVEEQADGKIKYAFSNLPPQTSRKAAVRLWKSRWPVEQGYQQMKEELGLDHFEGRSWRGFHHHAAMVLLAYGFLLLERHRAANAPRLAAKKGRRQPALTLPGIRRASAIATRIER